MDHQFNVKIADLELGMMAGPGLSAYDVPGGDADLSLPEDSMNPQGLLGQGYVAPTPLSSAVANNNNSKSNGNNSKGGGGGVEEREALLGKGGGATAVRPGELLAPMRSSSTHTHTLSRDPECVNVNELLANWLAPEVTVDVPFPFSFLC